jgi:hypothetical protein
MSRRRKILLGSLIGALADYRTRVKADGGVVEALTCANSLDADFVMIPSGYKATTLYSQIGTDGVDDFDVSRNSIATRVNKSGLIEEVAIDVPRLDYTDGACPVLLTEPQSTNLITYSEDFSEWLFSSSAVVDSNTVVSPDGTLNASKFSSESALTNINIKEIVALGSGNYTQSLYVKQGDFDSLRLRISGTDVGTSGQTLSIYDFSFITEQITKVSGGTVDNTKVDVFGNEWYRISLSFSATTITQQVIYCQPNGGGDIGGVYIWGAQLEELTYPTSYIPTAGSTVTRLADAVTGAGDVNSFNSEEGVFYMEMAALADDGTSRFISISDGTYDNAVTIIFHATSNQIWGYIKVSGSPIAILVHTLNDATSYIKAALKWKLNDFSLWVDGTEVATDSLGTMPIADTLNELSFYRGDISNPFFGKVKALKVFKTALSDAELETLTT